MRDRFIIPDGFSKDDVTLYSIIDHKEMLRYTVPSYTPFHMMYSASCQAFGISWWENEREFMQIFSYRGATIAEMESLPDDDGGFDYICFKTGVLPKDIEMLTDGLSQPSNTDITVLGWKHHMSNYFYASLEEATFVTYLEARKEARLIAQRLGKNLVEVIPQEDVCYNLEDSKRTYSTIELNPFDME